MNIRQVEIFKAIMDAGSITGAADKLHVSQPAISKHLKHLEADLGLSLFQRTGNRLSATAEAEALYDQINRTYQGLEQLDRFADGLKHHAHGEFTVAAMPLMAERWLPEVAGDFLSRHDTVSMSLPVRSSRWIHDAILNASIDFGIGLAMDGDDDALREPLLSLPLVCLLPPGHPLKAGDVVTPPDLEGENLITLSNFDHWRFAVEKTLEEHNISARRRVDTFTTHVACELALKGVGIAIVDGLTAMSYAAAGVEVRRFSPRVQFDVFLLKSRHRRLSTLVDRFAEAVVAQAAQTQAIVMESVEGYAAAVCNRCE